MRRDGRGPEGRGPMTGRGLGNCQTGRGLSESSTAVDGTEEERDIAEERLADGFGYGRGYGRGYGFSRAGIPNDRFAGGFGFRRSPYGGYPGGRGGTGFRGGFSRGGGIGRGLGPCGRGMARGFGGGRW